MERRNANAAIIQGTVSSAAEYYNMDFQIRLAESEAYGAVLFAFHAQSDSISWGKERLMTELRKELRVTDDEHREMLERINSDHLINSIREQHKGSDAQNLRKVIPPAPAFMSIGHTSCKRLKPAHAAVVTSAKCPPRAEHSSAPLAVIKDAQWANNAAVFSPRMHAAAGQMMGPHSKKRQAPSGGKVRGSMIVQTSKKGPVHSGAENKPDSDIIEICETDKLIHEVEKVYHEINPDPAKLERAKLILRDHERALMEAIGKLADVPDDDSSEHWHSNEERERNARGPTAGACDQLDRNRKSYGEDDTQFCAERARMPCINVQEDEYNQVYQMRRN